MSLEKAQTLVAWLRKNDPDGPSDLALLTKKSDQAFFLAFMLTLGGFVLNLREDQISIFISLGFYASAVAVFATYYRKLIEARDWLLSRHGMNLSEFGQPPVEREAAGSEVARHRASTGTGCLG